MSKENILFAELSFKITGLFFRVHNKLGRFRSEKTYGDALEKELQDAEISYVREVPIGPSFEEENPRRNIPEFLIEDTIVIDLKAKRIVTKEDYFQMKRYLAASKKRLGIIVNFRQNYLAPKRVAN